MSILCGLNGVYRHSEGEEFSPKTSRWFKTRHCTGTLTSACVQRRSEVTLAVGTIIRSIYKPVDS